MEIGYPSFSTAQIDTIETVGASRLLAVRSRNPADHAQFNAWLGSPADMVLQFCEDANGASTWAQNLAIVEKICADWAGIDVRHQWAFPGCSTTEPLSDTAAGKYDGVIRKMFERIAAFDKHLIVPFRVMWEANNPTAYPWTFSGAGASIATYLTAYRRIVDIGRSVSPRFKFGWCLLPSTIGTDGQVVNPEPAYPGDAYADFGDQDFYYDASTELAGGTHIQRLNGKLNAAYGPVWLANFFAAKGKPIAFTEMGINADAPDYINGWMAWLRQQNLFYWGYFNVNVNQGQFRCQLSNDQYPAASAAFINQNGPLSILTPATFNAPTGSAFSAKLEANKSVQWSFVGAYGPFSISIGSDGRTIQLVSAAQAAGTRTVTVRATDERGQSVTKTMAVTFAAGALQPESQFYLSRAATVQPTGYQAALNNLVGGLKANGFWAWLDRMFLFQNTDAGLAVCDLMSIRHFGNLIGNTTFTAKTGIRSDGTTGYFDTQFQPSIVSHRYQQNDLHFGLWSQTSLSRAGNVDAFEFGAGGTVSMFRVSNGNIAGRVGTTNAAATLAGAGWDGHTMAVRTGSAAWRSYRKGAPALTGTDTSTTPPFETLKALAAQVSNGQFGANDIAIDHFGSGAGWTDANVATFVGLLQGYRNAVVAL
jgi:hypothetical protein